MKKFRQTEKSQWFLCMSSSISVDNGAVGPPVLQAEAGLSQLRNKIQHRMDRNGEFNVLEHQ